MEKKKLLRASIGLLILFLVPMPAYAFSPNIESGITWFSANQNPDGSWGSNADLAILDTSTVLDTFKSLNIGSPAYSNGVTWLSSQSPLPTDFVSRKVTSLSITGVDVSSDLSMLVNIRSSDGGWGGDADSTGMINDTALALQALKAANYLDQNIINGALGFLVATQNPDGGWGFYPAACLTCQADPSNVYMTAMVASTLQQFTPTTSLVKAINKATGYLVAHQNTDGGFGSSQSTIYETALAYIALVGVTTDETILGKAANHLTSSQLADGSWLDDPYATALAIKALYLAENKPQPPPPPDKGTATGKVIDSSTNALLKAVSVTLESDAGINTMTDQAGTFTLANCPPGTQKLIFTLPGYTGGSASLAITAGTIVDLGTIPLAPNPTTGMVKGLVTESATGMPLAGVVIDMTGSATATTTTAADGTFSFIDVAPGAVTLTASKAGYYAVTGSGNVLAGGVLFFNPQLSTTPPSSTTGKLIGKIVAGATGNPITGAVVAIDGGSVVSTDAQGIFSIDNIVAGSHQVTITAAGYGALNYQVIISAGGTTDMGTISLTAGPSVTTTITGVVTDATTGNPIAGADIAVVGTSLSAKTATDGSYSISSIQLLEFSVRVSASGYNSKISTVNTTQLGTYTVNIVLSRSATGDLKITSLALDSASYTANSPLAISATLENTGGKVYGIFIYAEIKDVNNNTIDKIILQPEPLNINPNSTNQMSMNWNVGRNIPGNYQLVFGVVDSGSGTLLAEKSVVFTIIPTVSISGVRLNIIPQYIDVATTQTIKLSANFNNRSNVAATLKAKYEVKDTSGNLINNGEVDIPVNVSDSIKTVDIGSLTYTFNQSGQYPVNIKVFFGNDMFADKTDFIYVAPALRIEPSKKLTPDNVIPGEDKKINIGIQLKGIASLAVLSIQTNINGDKLTIAFNKAMSDPSGKNAQFGVTADGVMSSVTAIALNAADNTKIELTLQTPIFEGQTVLLNYAAGDIQSADGEQLASFSNYAVINKVAIFFYNGDGLGFSGMVAGIPLGNDVSITGYDSWPSGFTKTSAAFIGGVFDGQNIWMIPHSAAMVTKVDINSGKMVGFNAWPAGFTKVNYAFSGAAFDGQNIWMMPYNADRVVKINVSTGTMTGFNAWPVGFTKNTNAFSGAAFDGQNIWMIPQRADRVIKIDKDTGTMAGFNAWPAGFNAGSYAFSGGVFDGQNIWLIPYDANMVVMIDKDTGNMTGYNAWPAGFSKANSGFQGGVYDGQNIWLMPYNADRVIKINKDTGTMSGYNTWPSGFSKNSAAFAGGAFDGKDIWMIPASASAIIKINKKTGIMTKSDNWPSGYITGNDSFRGGVFDGQNIWMIPYNAAFIMIIKTAVNDISLSVKMTVDNGFTAYISQDESIAGVIIGQGDNWGSTYSISAALVPDVTNYLHVKGTDWGVIAAFLGDFKLNNRDFSFANGTQKLLTGINSWTVYTDKFGGTVGTITAMGKNGVSPWGMHTGIDPNAEWIWTNNGADINTSRFFSTPIYYATPTPTNIRVIDTIPGTNIVVDQTSFSKTPYSISVGADSTVIEWRFNNFTLTQTEDLSFDVIMQNPVPGEDRLINQKLEVLYIDLDGNSVRTELGPHYVYVLDAAFETGIATDKPTYQANEDVLINARIKNLSEYARTVDAKILIEDSSGVLVKELTTIANLNFEAGEEKIYDNLVFNTGTTLSGDYRAHLLLFDAQKQVGEALANFIIGADIGVSSMVATDKMSYQVYEPVTITSTVQSTSANYILTDLLAQITLKDSAGAALFTDTKTIPILAPGSRLEFNSFWNTAANPAGMYAVVLEILKGTTSLSIAQTSFSIAGSPQTGEGITGTITASPSPVYRGDKEAVAYSITNIGNMDIANLQVQVLIVNPDTKEIKHTYNASATVTMGSASEGGFSLSTIPLEPRKYLAILRVQSPAMSEPKTIANALFEVIPGLEATKGILDMVNLLVWINDKCNHHPAQKGAKCPEPPSHDCIRVDLVEQILREAAINYFIVYDKDAFEYEMRNPFYTDFMILGDQAPLTDHHADELREQVYAGKGLLSSLYLKHGICIGPEHEDEPLFGLTYHGKLPGFTHKIDIPQGLLPAAVSFKGTGDALRVEVDNPTQILGWIGWQRGENCNPTPKEYPGIVQNQYGAGKTLFFAFDIGKTLDEESYQIISEIIKKGLSLIHTPANTEFFSPYQYVPIAITLKDLDGAIDLRITETYPQGIKIYDPYAGTWITDRPWQCDIHLDSEETETIFYYAFTPDQAGTHVLQTTIEYAEVGNYYPCQMLSVTLPIAQDAAQTAQEILAALDALEVSRHSDKAAIKLAMMFINNVKTRTVRSPLDAEKNIYDILKAVDAVLSIESADTSDIRLMMAELLKIWEAKAYAFPRSQPHS